MQLHKKHHHTSSILTKATGALSLTTVPGYGTNGFGSREQNAAAVKLRKHQCGESTGGAGGPSQQQTRLHPIRDALSEAC